MFHFNINRTLVFLLVAAMPVFTACHKEKNDFQGRDNFITGFTLKKDGTTFTASIADSVIVINAPEGLSLDGAIADVSLSEHASMFPDPASINQWDEEALFVVNAWNGQRKTYKYTVNRTSINVAGSVVLTTQADVDAFAKQGATEVAGSLIIGSIAGKDSITSLAALYKLKRIDYSLIIYPTLSARQIVGLDNLQSVGNDIQIQTADTLDIVAFPALESAGSISIQSVLIDALNFPKLKQVAKFLNINASVSSFTAPILQQVKGAVTLSTDAFSGALMQVVSFPALTTTGNFTISNFRQLTKLDCPVLTKTGDLKLDNLTSLFNVSCPKLQTAGYITLPGESKLTQISFPALTQAGGWYMAAKTINTLELPLLKTISGDLLMWDNSLRTFSMPLLEEVSGSINITQMSQLTQSAVEWPVLKKVGVDFYLQIQSALVNRLSCAALASVGGDLVVGTGYGTTSLATVSFPKLTTITGNLRLFAEQAPSNPNSKLTSLDGFTALSKVKSIDVSGQSVLTSFAGLQLAIPGINAAAWRASGNNYNPTYSDLQAGKWTKP
ncbi:hypothetical protein A4H97_18350 [Niastella yeongjuensis]|uniref:Receptor L-domain domain-containing protein n=1 Tax=Niastella yeongjuensis TaxID=354355 RepID=A0A1V9DXW3_9BACT|nr:hypothetical protein [Niastella yeongjuensis]OQP38680.1 hypothetical protein A4H97_18350 [Niastella yeongjuensis]SEO36662.1 hypothetical protein SAMN05660816_02732 [Niastella yeongjuensis]